MDAVVVPVPVDPDKMIGCLCLMLMDDDQLMPHLLPLDHLLPLNFPWILLIPSNYSLSIYLFIREHPDRSSLHPCRLAYPQLPLSVHTLAPSD